MAADRTRLLALALAAVLAVGLLAPVASAGDAVAVFEFGEDRHSAAPGETVQVDVYLASDGGYGGEGIDSYAFVVAVDPEIGRIVDVDPGPFLAGDGGEVGGNVTRPEAGAVRIEHRRVGADDGQTGREVAATVTIEIAEDAPSADAVVEVLEPEARLVESDFPLQTFGRNTTVAVDGGGERYDPAFGDASDDESDRVSATTAEEAGREVETEDESTPATADDGLPGFGVLAALAALAAFLAARVPD